MTPYADEQTVQILLSQLAQAEHNAHRWGHDDALRGLRGILADALDDVGRDREAQLLRTQGRHVLITPEGIRPGRFNEQHSVDAFNEVLRHINDINGGEYPLPETDMYGPHTRSHFRPEDFLDPEGFLAEPLPGFARIIDPDPFELHSHEDVPYPHLPQALADRLQEHLDIHDGFYEYPEGGDADLNALIGGLRQARVEEEDPDAVYSQYARTSYGDRESLEAAIRAQPLEATPHLELSDWFREFGDEQEADFRGLVGNSIERRLQNPWEPPQLTLRHPADSRFGEDQPNLRTGWLRQPNPHGPIDPFTMPASHSVRPGGLWWNSWPLRTSGASSPGDWSWGAGPDLMNAPEGTPTISDLMQMRLDGSWPGSAQTDFENELFPAERIYAGIDDLNAVSQNPALWDLVEQIMRQQHERGMKFEDDEEPTEYAQPGLDADGYPAPKPIKPPVPQYPREMAPDNQKGAHSNWEGILQEIRDGFNQQNQDTPPPYPGGTYPTGSAQGPREGNAPKQDDFYHQPPWDHAPTQPPDDIFNAPGTGWNEVPPGTPHQNWSQRGLQLGTQTQAQDSDLGFGDYHEPSWDIQPPGNADVFDWEEGMPPPGQPWDDNAFNRALINRGLPTEGPLAREAARRAQTRQNAPQSPQKAQEPHWTDEGGYHPSWAPNGPRAPVAKNQHNTPKGAWDWAKFWKNSGDGQPTHYAAQNELASFLQHIAREPDEQTHRAVLADWLEEYYPDAIPDQEVLQWLRTFSGSGWASMHPETQKIAAGPKLSWDDIRSLNGEDYRWIPALSHLPGGTFNGTSGYPFGSHFGILGSHDPYGDPYSGPLGHAFVTREVFEPEAGGGESYFVWRIDPRTGEVYSAPGMMHEHGNWIEADSHARRASGSDLTAPFADDVKHLDPEFTDENGNPYANEEQATPYSDQDDERGLRAAINANPVELTTHGAYADFLQEQNRPEDEAFRRALMESIERRREWGPAQTQGEAFGVDAPAERFRFLDQSQTFGDDPYQLHTWSDRLLRGQHWERNLNGRILQPQLLRPDLHDQPHGWRWALTQADYYTPETIEAFLREQNPAEVPLDHLEDTLGSGRTATPLYPDERLLAGIDPFAQLADDPRLRRHYPALEALMRERFNRNQRFEDDTQPTEYGFPEDRAHWQDQINADPLDATRHLVFADFLQDNDDPDAGFRRDMGNLIHTRVGTPWVDKSERTSWSGFPLDPTIRGFSELHIPQHSVWSVDEGYDFPPSWSETDFRPNFSTREIDPGWNWENWGIRGTPEAGSPESAWIQWVSDRAGVEWPSMEDGQTNWARRIEAQRLTPAEQGAFDFTKPENIDPAIWPQIEAILRNSWGKFQKFEDDEEPTDYADFPTRMITDQPILPRLRKRKRGMDYYEDDEDPTDYAEIWEDDVIRNNPHDVNLLGASADWFDDNAQPQEAIFRREAQDWLHQRLGQEWKPIELDRDGLIKDRDYPFTYPTLQASFGTEVGERWPAWWGQQQPRHGQAQERPGTPFWWGMRHADSVDVASPEHLAELMGVDPQNPEFQEQVRHLQARGLNDRLRDLTPVEQAYGGITDIRNTSPEEWLEIINLMRQRRAELRHFEDDEEPTEYGTREDLESHIAASPLDVDPHLELSDWFREFGDEQEADFRGLVGNSIQRRLQNPWTELQPQTLLQTPSHGSVDPYFRAIYEPRTQWGSRGLRLWYPSLRFTPNLPERTVSSDELTAADMEADEPETWHWVKPSYQTRPEGLVADEVLPEHRAHRELFPAERIYAGIDDLNSVNQNPALWELVEQIMRQQHGRGMKFEDEAPAMYAEQRPGVGGRTPEELYAFLIMRGIDPQRAASAAGIRGSEIGHSDMEIPTNWNVGEQFDPTQELQGGMLEPNWGDPTQRLSRYDDRESLQQAITQNPWESDIHLRLADLEAEQGNEPEALFREKIGRWLPERVKFGANPTPVVQDGQRAWLTGPYQDQPLEWRVWDGGDLAVRTMRPRMGSRGSLWGTFDFNDFAFPEQAADFFGIPDAQARQPGGLDQFLLGHTTERHEGVIRPSIGEPLNAAENAYTGLSHLDPDTDPAIWPQIEAILRERHRLGQRFEDDDEPTEYAHIREGYNEQDPGGDMLEYAPQVPWREAPDDEPPNYAENPRFAPRESPEYRALTARLITHPGDHNARKALMDLLVEQGRTTEAEDHGRLVDGYLKDTYAQFLWPDHPSQRVAVELDDDPMWAKRNAQARPTEWVQWEEGMEPPPEPTGYASIPRDGHGHLSGVMQPISDDEFMGGCFGPQQTNRHTAYGTQDALRAQIAQTPLEVDPHLRLADWLMENDQEDEGLFREQIGRSLQQRLSAPWNAAGVRGPYGQIDDLDGPQLRAQVAESNHWQGGHYFPAVFAPGFTSPPVQGAGHANSSGPVDWGWNILDSEIDRDRFPGFPHPGGRSSVEEAALAHGIDPNSEIYPWWAENEAPIAWRQLLNPAHRWFAGIDDPKNLDPALWPYIENLMRRAKQQGVRFEDEEEPTEYGYTSIPRWEYDCGYAGGMDGLVNPILYPPNHRPQKPLQYDPEGAGGFGGATGDMNVDSTPERDYWRHRGTDYGLADDEAGFRQAIEENPYELMNHLAFADWLQEQGQLGNETFRRDLADWMSQQSPKTLEDQESFGPRMPWMVPVSSRLPTGVLPGNISRWDFRPDRRRVGDDGHRYPTDPVDAHEVLRGEDADGREGDYLEWQTYPNMEDALYIAWLRGRGANFSEDEEPVEYGQAEDIASFHDAIRNNPLEVTNHLVMADFLQDHDSPEAPFRRQVGDWVSERLNNPQAPQLGPGQYLVQDPTKNPYQMRTWADNGTGNVQGVFREPNWFGPWPDHPKDPEYWTWWPQGAVNEFDITDAHNQEWLGLSPGDTVGVNNREDNWWARHRSLAANPNNPLRLTIPERMVTGITPLGDLDPQNPEHGGYAWAEIERWLRERWNRGHRM